jgi:hypothetical protein
MALSITKIYHYAELRCVEHHILFIVMLNVVLCVVMLDVVMLNVVVLDVVILNTVVLSVAFYLLLC